MAERTVAAGTPEDVAKVKESYTGQYLRELLGRRAKAEKQAAEQGLGPQSRYLRNTSLAGDTPSRTKRLGRSASASLAALSTTFPC